ncbi:anti-sigma factor [Streptomyces sp. Je 1-79]|uniref:anti-sigma factor n=1 Tax=Streptomyces sp. Je 1-79 TaxID=2943847 RepID=UPI0021A3CCF4|nr:anti-sigma factor [Streptomyces sp. Je 1-79]MCT4351873.1 anti-sigma factor [Streptomyces sp. Je 1-79]
MTQPDPHLDAGAYVLHALPPAEEAAFRNHLAGCEACRRDVAEFEETVVRLAAAESASLPPLLRTRVLDIVSHTRQDRVPDVPRPPRRVPRALRFALAASVAAAVGLGGVAAWQHSQAEDARVRAAQALEEVRTAEAAFTDVLTAPDATIHTESLSGGATAAVVVSRTEAEAVFTAHGLPALTGGKVYELWYAAASGDLRAAGLMPGTGERSARVLEGPLGDAVAVGITVEPAGGSKQPTTEPLGLVPIDS